MAVYVIVAFLLFVFACGEQCTERSRLWPTLSLIVVLVFAATRFETGFDWMAYEQAFDELPTPKDAFANGIPDQTLPVEPLYAAFNMIVKSLTDEVTIIFVIASAFSIVTLHMAVGRISRSQSVMWLIYFGLVFLAVQMGAVRASIASSLILVGLICAVKQRRFLGLLILCIAAGFHSFAVVFLPLLFIAQRQPPTWLCVGVVGCGVPMVVLNIQIVDAVIGAIVPYVPALVADKLASFYYGIEPAPLSAATLGLIFAQGLLLVIFCLRTERERHDPYVTVAQWLTLYMLIAHLCFAGFPAIWNRLMYVALPWQIAALWRTAPIVNFRTGAKLASVYGLGAISIAALVYFLTSPAALLFIPYQSAIFVWLTGDYGDGRERTTAWVVEHQNDAINNR